MTASARLRPDRPRRRVEVAVGVAAAGGAAALLGPALAPGGLLSLDLVLTPRIPFPDAALGLGDDLPRRVPLGVLLSWAAAVMGGPAAGKLLLLAALSGAFVGAARLARDAPLAARLAAGTVYALGPFAATRLGAGHWTVLAAMAVLPWALPHLLVPTRDLGRTFVWLLALSLTGVFGGVLGLAAAAAGYAHERRAGLRLAAFGIVGQVPWLLPAILLGGSGAAGLLGGSGAAGLLGGSGAAVAGGEHFATRSEGALGGVTGALLAQHGFWRGASQVGGEVAPGLVLLATGFLGLALAGHTSLPAPWRRPLAALAAVGLVLAAAPALPGLDALHARATSWLGLAPLRESQRALALFLVWLAPAAALGAARLARTLPGGRAAALALPLAAALTWAFPGLWGVEGRLEPVTFPESWPRAREIIAADRGPVVALPWHQYLNLGFADDRRVLNPLPDYLAGDVVSSHDPELGDRPLQESLDPRERAVRSMVPGVRGRDLAPLGIRWVVLVHEADWKAYGALASDHGLRPVLRTDSVDLYEVNAWVPVPQPRPAWKPAVALTGYAVCVSGAALVLWRRRPGGRPATARTR